MRGEDDQPGAGCLYLVDFDTLPGLASHADMGLKVDQDRCVRPDCHVAG
jgi:hypothetical protein